MPAPQTVDEFCQKATKIESLIELYLPRSDGKPSIIRYMHHAFYGAVAEAAALTTLEQLILKNDKTSLANYLNQNTDLVYQFCKCTRSEFLNIFYNEEGKSIEPDEIKPKLLEIYKGGKIKKAFDDIKGIGAYEKSAQEYKESWKVFEDKIKTIEDGLLNKIEEDIINLFNKTNNEKATLGMLPKNFNSDTEWASYYSTRMKNLEDGIIDSKPSKEQKREKLFEIKKLKEVINYFRVNEQIPDLNILDKNLLEKAGVNFNELETLLYKQVPHHPFSKHVNEGNEFIKIFQSGTKNFDRALQKLINQYCNGNSSDEELKKNLHKLKDLLRCSVMPSSPEVAESHRYFLSDILKHKEITLQGENLEPSFLEEIKVSFALYVDRKLRLSIYDKESGIGIVAEIQYVTEEMVKAKKTAQLLYEIRRLLSQPENNDFKKDEYFKNYEWAVKNFNTEFKKLDLEKLDKSKMSEEIGHAEFYQQLTKIEMELYKEPLLKMMQDETWKEILIPLLIERNKKCIGINAGLEFDLHELGISQELINNTDVSHQRSHE
jgi:hypothetical protein